MIQLFDTGSYATRLGGEWLAVCAAVAGLAFLVFAVWADNINVRRQDENANGT